MNYRWTASPPASYSKTDTSRIGVHVLKRQGSTTTYSWIQFLKVVSPIAFGTLGIDFAVSGQMPENMMIVVRDYIVTAGDVNGSGAGSVVAYAYNITSGLFFQVQNITGSSAGSTGNYWAEDYFGVGLSMAYDSVSNVTCLMIGAPKEGQKLYSFGLNNAALIRTNGFNSVATGSSFWSQQSIMTNPLQDSVTFFGGTTVLTSDARYMFVGDAVSSTGYGTVHVYRRYIANEQPLGFENVPIPSNIISSTGSTVSGSPYFGFYRIGTLSKGTSYNGTYTIDQFGVAIATNWWLTVVGAPAEECMYTFLSPQSYQGLVDIPSNFTAVSVPTQTPEVSFSGSSSNVAASWMWAVIGSIIAIVIIGKYVYIALNFFKL